MSFSVCVLPQAGQEGVFSSSEAKTTQMTDSDLIWRYISKGSFIVKVVVFSGCNDYFIHTDYKPYKNSIQ